MYPTLKEGEGVLTFNWGKIHEGDIVVTKVKSQKSKIKRVQRIMGNKVYLLGDNKQVCHCCGKKESTDSRHFGPVNRSQVIGKVLYYFHDSKAGK